MSAIDDKWRQIPWVGNPRDEGAGSAEMALPDGRGRVRDFWIGRVFRLYPAFLVAMAAATLVGHPT